LGVLNVIAYLFFVIPIVAHDPFHSIDARAAVSRSHQGVR
jgi:hypothetical protein